MGLNDLVNRAKDVITKRGGTESVKEDADEPKDVATSDESMTEKAQDAPEALKDPGAEGESHRPPS